MLTYMSIESHAITSDLLFHYIYIMIVMQPPMNHLVAVINGQILNLEHLIMKHYIYFPMIVHLHVL